MRNGMMNRDASKNTVWLLLCNGSPLHAHILMTATSLPKKIAGGINQLYSRLSNKPKKKPASSSSLREGKGEQLLLHSPLKKISWKTATVNKNSKIRACMQDPPPLPTTAVSAQREFTNAAREGTQRDGRRRRRRRSTRKDQKHVYGRASVRMSLREGEGRSIFIFLAPFFFPPPPPHKKVKHSAGRRL